MSSPKVINEKHMSLSEVKVEIENIKKRDKELGFRTQKTDEYLQHFVQNDTKKLSDSLHKLEIARLKEEHIAKIADLLPKSMEDLKGILQGYTLTVTKENMKKIVDEVNKFLEKA